MFVRFFLLTVTIPNRFVKCDPTLTECATKSEYMKSVSKVALSKTGIGS